MDPLTLFLISQGIALGTSAVGGYIQNEANKKTAKANDRFSNEQLKEQKRQNRFAEGISAANLAISQDQNTLSKSRFALDEQAQNYTMTQAEINKLEKLMNNNAALRQQVIQNWS